MTLEDTDKMKMCKTDNNMNIGTNLRETLLAAKCQNRLTCGIYESGKQLKMNPDGVMLCVLPANVAQDVTLQIHAKLIEAFCWENDIKVVKVDSRDKLSSILDGASRPLNDNDLAAGRTAPKALDYNCIIIEHPRIQYSQVEEDVMEFCRMTSDLSPLPVVELAST